MMSGALIALLVIATVSLLGGTIAFIVVIRLRPIQQVAGFLIRKSLEHAGVVCAMDCDLLIRVQSSDVVTVNRRDEAILEIAKCGQ
jgi:hypothetical protein